jgi:hypothetical protein
MKIYTTKQLLHKGIILLTMLLTGFVQYGQIQVQNAEKYSIGMEISHVNFDQIDPDTGISGPSITWDYSNITTYDTILMSIISPDSTPYSSYKNSDFVEFTSDSTYVFVDQNDSQSKLNAFISRAQDLEISYPKKQMFMTRPISYLDRHTSSYTNSYTANGYAFSGSGASIVEADGYGNLILPNQTYSNVLRVVIRQKQIDTLLAFNSVHESESVSYLWFDGIHPEPILRIFKYSTPQGNTISSNYRISSNTLNTSQVLPSNKIEVYPNPFSDELKIKMNANMKNASYSIVNELGQVCKSGTMDNDLNTIQVDQLPSGTYSLFVNSAYLKRIIKL